MLWSQKSSALCKFIALFEQSSVVFFTKSCHSSQFLTEELMMCQITLKLKSWMDFHMFGSIIYSSLGLVFWHSWTVHVRLCDWYRIYLLKVLMFVFGDQGHGLKLLMREVLVRNYFFRILLIVDFEITLLWILIVDFLCNI
jgi:hypothetical protein